MAHTEILKPRTLHTPSLKRTKSCSTIYVELVTHQISLTKYNINHSNFPCRICEKSVHDKDKADQCGLCEFWIYIKCNKLNYLD